MSCPKTTTIVRRFAGISTCPGRGERRCSTRWIWGRCGSWRSTVRGRGEDRGEVDVDRLTWLEAELALAPDRVTLLALHHPPVTTGILAWDEIGLSVEDRRGLGEVLQRHPQVRRVVAGHVHRTIAAELAGRAVLAVPSTYMQARLSFNADEIEVVAEPPGFAVHAVLDGELASHVQPVS
jgi:Icc protein